MFNINISLIEFIFDSVKEILAYKRVGEDGDILVLNNMSKDEVSLPQSIDMTGRKILLSNYDESRISGIDVLRPYECIVIQ